MQSRSFIQPDEVQMAAAADALAVQDACNIVAIVGAFQRQLLALHRSGICGDDLINHPVAIAFTSKLNSLCRLSLARESAAFDCLAQLQRGEPIDYEIIPIN